MNDCRKFWLLLPLCFALTGFQAGAEQKYGLKHALETGIWRHKPLPAERSTPPGRPMLSPDVEPDISDMAEGEVNLFLVHQGKELFPCGPDQAVTIDYSVGDTDRRKCPPVGVLPDQIRKWTATAVLNGARFFKNEPKCTANPNVAQKSLSASLENISYDDRADRLSLRAASKYDAKGDYDSTLWYTSIRANRKYLRFWSNSVDIHMNNSTSASGAIESNATSPYPAAISPVCDNNNQCVIDTTVHLNVPDRNGQAMNNQFARGKKAFAMLQGFEFDHDGARRKFRAAKVALRLSDDTVAADGTLPIRIIVKYRGKQTPKALNAKVHFMVGVYDPEQVAYVGLSPTQTASWTNSGFRREVIDSVSVPMPWGRPPKGDFVCPNAGCDKAKVLPMFVGLRSWGFDLDKQYQVKSIRGLARLRAVNDLAGDNARLSVRYAGEAHRNKCLVRDRVETANRMWAGAVVCRNIDVCHAAEHNFIRRDVSTSFRRTQSHQFPNQELVPLATMLEEQFPFSTRGLMRLNVVDMLQVGQPSQFDKSFLDLKPFADSECQSSNPGWVAMCEASRDIKYSDFLRPSSEIRFYYHETEDGKNNAPEMYDPVVEAAGSAEWDSDKQILIVVPNAKIGSLGVYFQNHYLGASPQPYEQLYLSKPVPYQTEWNHVYYLADEIIHEVGHGFGLGHDCEDADGNPFDCVNGDTIMAHWRERPSANGEAWVNQFSQCALDNIRAHYLNTVSDGGPRGSSIAGYECN